MKAPRDPKHHKIASFEKSEVKIHLSDGPNCPY